MTSRPELRTFAFRPMDEADLPVVHRLSRSVGWPHRIEDWALALRLGAGVIALEPAGIAGTVMWWRYGDTQARVGMVIVHPSLQRAGLGRQLMTACLNQLEVPTCILNATAAGESLYRTLGFVPIETIEQYQGIATQHEVAPASLRIRKATALDMHAIVAMDRQAIGAPRGHVLEALAAAGEVVVAEGAAGLQGVAVCRRFGRGHLIGPLTAANETIASELAAYWLARRTGEFVRIDTPPARGLPRRLAAFGLGKVDSVVSMVKGQCSDCGPMLCYALASQALG